VHSLADEFVPARVDSFLTPASHLAPSNSNGRSAIPLGDASLMVCSAVAEVEKVSRSQNSYERGSLAARVDVRCFGTYTPPPPQNAHRTLLRIVIQLLTVSIRAGLRNGLSGFEHTGFAAAACRCSFIEIFSTKEAGSRVQDRVFWPTRKLV